MSRERRRGGDEPAPIAESLHAIEAELGLPDPDVLETLHHHWVEIVGDAAAPHTKPRTVRDGVLRVTVDDAAWATELRYLAGDLLDRIDEIVGVGTVVQVRVTVAPTRG